MFASLKRAEYTRRPVLEMLTAVPFSPNGRSSGGPTGSSRFEASAIRLQARKAAQMTG